MTEKNFKKEFGILEAISLTRCAVKVNGLWIRFGPQCAPFVGGLLPGDFVRYICAKENPRKLKFIRRVEQADYPAPLWELMQGCS